ncbi:MAG: sugar transferase [Candidatus Nealsonbacteria bacterium]|nr:sugar transferase [Candidatus Nealsonbacteria bacterium]
MIYIFFKRLFDIVISLWGLVVLFLPLIIVSILIKIDSNGPVFYRPERTGRNGRKFRIFKFRTMVLNADKIGGPSTAFEDGRLTKIGKFLRRYKIDEFPQLINILSGQMSFVGPRPQVEEYTSKYEGEQKLILSVRPGLTDYASIEFINLDKILGNVNVDEKYRTEVEPRKNELRLQYVKERSFMVDMKIIFYTLARFLKLRQLWK